MKQDYDKLLIDGDVLAYRAAFSCQDTSEQDAIEKLDDIVYEILDEVYWDAHDDDIKDSYIVYLTGKGNFRYDYAVSYPYKGNRKNTEKPIHLRAIRDHMIDNWDAVVSEGEEADDLIGIGATNYGPDTIVATIDKDMLQLPCVHYNPSKKTWKTVDEFGGLKFFYHQILTGDTSDNIIGLKGVGPKTADKLLAEVDTECDMFKVVLDAYEGDVDRIMENARLLWLRREVGQIWEAPECGFDLD